MKNIFIDFGENAGKIWNALNEQGPLTETKLTRTTKLNDDEFYNAIGWLARENKIYTTKSGDSFIYSLGATNLTSKIGSNAGKIWKTLHTYGENDIRSISQLTTLNRKDVEAAIGWLAREDKIQVKHENRETKFYLNGK